MSLKNPRSILVAVDTSKRAPFVLSEGIDLAQKLGGQLVLLRAVSISYEIPNEALAASPDTVPEILERVARADLESRAREIPPGMLKKLIVEIGAPWEVICRSADDEDVDLIVIGSHGYSGIDRLLGTTASRVVNHTTRSVLVVRNFPIDGSMKL